MHPNRRFLAHFAVHMPLCLHDLFRIAHPLHSNRGGGRGNRHWGYVPSGVRGYRDAQVITVQGGEGVVNTEMYCRCSPKPAFLTTFWTDWLPCYANANAPQKGLLVHL